MKKIILRSNGTKRVVTENNLPDKCDPSWKDEVNVNNIMKKYLKTGQVTHLAKHQGKYADVSQIPDLATALSQVTQAQTAFDTLPASLRARFGNSPIALVNFLQDSQNDAEAIKLGLKVARPSSDNTLGTESSPSENKPKGRVSKKDSQNEGTD